MVKIFLRLYRLLPGTEQRRMRRMLAFQVIAAIVETLGVFSILPFLALASDPGRLSSDGLAADFYRWSGADSTERFLVYAGIATLGAIVFNSVFGLLNMMWTARFAGQVSMGLNRLLVELIFTRRYAFFLGQNGSVLGNSILTEAANLYNYATYPTISLISRGITVALILVGLVFYDPVTSLVIIAGVGGFYFLVFIWVGGRMNYYGDLRAQAAQRRSVMFFAGVNGIKDFKISGLEPLVTNTFLKESANIVAAGYKSATLQLAPRYLVDILVFGGVVCVLLWALLSGGNVQTLIPVLSVYAMAGYKLIPAVQTVYAGAAAMRFADAPLTKLSDLRKELETAPTEVEGDVEHLALARQMDLKSVSFSYAPGGKQVLSEISLSIPARGCIGIIGPSGSGKSTLMDVAMGLLEPTSGQIEVDGAALDDRRRRNWQVSVGYVPQQIMIFDLTLAENIALGVPHDQIDMERVVDAAKGACLHDFVAAHLPEGYATRVGDRGMRLSGGQRQRIGIARTLYRNPAVIFLDEATSALDNETEEAVVESIRHLSGQRTIVMIAHRLTTLRFCSRIVRIEGGRVVAEGSYEQLCK